MNILPFIFIFLTILTLTSYTFLHEKIATYKELTSYQGYMRAERIARNSLERTLYKKAAPARSDTHHLATAKKKEDTLYKSLRVKTPPGEAARLNISPLFSKNPPKLLYETSARLIRALYQEASFFKEAKVTDLEYQILDQICLETVPPKHLSDLMPNTPFLQQIFYKLLKGTNYYQITPLAGYPPLQDFITLSTKQGLKPIQFPYASEKLLIALFGEEVTEEIIEAEKKKWEKDHKHHTLLETELFAILHKHPKLQIKMTDFKELLHFDTKRPPLETTKHTDPRSKITIRRNKTN